MKCYITSIYMIMLGALTCLSAQAQNTKIYWSDRDSLTWEDYESSPSGAAYESALTMCKIEITYNGRYVKDSLVIDAEIKPAFLPGESWVREEAATVALLRHENLHFDIAELFARKMRKAFIEETFSKDNYKEKIKGIYQRYKEAMKEYRQQYADETFYGSRVAIQKNWEQKIHLALKEWELYSYKQETALKE